MIAKETIDLVQGACDIVQVAQHFIPLKKNGSNFSACCPFHNEKSPSFSVNPTRQRFKCFGCGKGGDAIQFVQEHEKKTFTEAIEWLADFYQVEVKYDGKLDKQAIQKAKDEEKERAQVLGFCEEWYHRQLMELPDDSEAWQALQQRGLGRAQAIAWRLGYAPTGGRALSQILINRGWYNTSLALSLLRTSSGVSYDFYQHRITIPIRDRNGLIAGFGGRALDAAAKAKYLNPAENDAYKKSELLFGLHEAQPGIRALQQVYVVEGYFDVISLHLAGVDNAVAPCGTALTEPQIRLLRRYTQHVVLLGDGDKAGKASMMKSIDLLLAQDMRVSVVNLPAGEDPDSWVRKQISFSNQPEPAQELEAA